MRVKHLIITAVLAGLPLFGNAASAATIEVIETFDFPGTGKLTEPQGINDRGDIVGYVTDAATGVPNGFYRDRKGRFSNEFAPPKHNVEKTFAYKINNARVICGVYIDARDFSFHPFFLTKGAYTYFEVPGAALTDVRGINNAGDFVGNYIIYNRLIFPAFVSLGGTITTFMVPNAIGTTGYGINDSNQIVGNYTSDDGVLHGFLRASDGTLTYPIDPDGSKETLLFGNNNSNWVVGRYVDAAGITHGVFFVTPDKFVTFDYPGSTFTSFNGINAQGYITGRYVDADGGEHGIVAKVHLDGNE